VRGVELTDSARWLVWVSWTEIPIGQSMAWYDGVGTLEADGGKCDPSLLVFSAGIVAVAKSSSLGCEYIDQL